jgi:hypothetical protein
MPVGAYVFTGLKMALGPMIKRLKGNYTIGKRHQAKDETKMVPCLLSNT